MAGIQLADVIHDELAARRQRRAPVAPDVMGLACDAMDRLNRLVADGQPLVRLTADEVRAINAMVVLMGQELETLRPLATLPPPLWSEAANPR